MPTSQSDYMVLTYALGNSPANTKWCGVKKNITKIHGYRTNANSNIVVSVGLLKSNGAITLWEGSLSIPKNTIWYQSTIDLTDVIGVTVYYNGSLGSSNEVRIYFD